VALRGLDPRGLRALDGSAEMRSAGAVVLAIALASVISGEAASARHHQRGGPRPGTPPVVATPESRVDAGQEKGSEIPWQYTAAITLSAALLAVATTGLIQEYFSRRDRRLRLESLLVAFFADVISVLGRLRVQWRTIENHLTLTPHGPLPVCRMDVSRTVFEANAAAIGYLRDSRLAANVVGFYGWLERVNEFGRRLDEGSLSSDSFPEYALFVVECGTQGVAMAQLLDSATSHIKPVLPDRPAPRSEWQDRDFRDLALIRDRLRGMFPHLEIVDPPMELQPENDGVTPR